MTKGRILVWIAALISGWFSVWDGSKPELRGRDDGNDVGCGEVPVVQFQGRPRWSGRGRWRWSWRPGPRFEQAADMVWAGNNKRL